MYNILLVDDEIIALNGLMLIIDWIGSGFSKPILAKSVKQAIAAIEERQIDIMICDIEMPSGTGFDLMRWINDNSLDIVTVFLTFHARFDYAKTAISLGAFEYLLKPVSSDELNDVLTHCVKRVEEIRILAREKASNDAVANAVFPPPDSAIVEKVVAYINNNLSQELTRKDLCSVANIHQDYLSKLFHQNTGVTVSAYIFERRMSKAMELLRKSDEPVAAIAESVGYAYPSHFSKMFKIKTGLNPQQYRSQFRRR